MFSHFTEEQTEFEMVGDSSQCVEAVDVSSVADRI